MSPGPATLPLPSQISVTSSSDGGLPPGKSTSGLPVLMLASSSSSSRSHASLAEAAEELPQIRHHQIRVGGVREVAAAAELGVPDDVVGSLGERPDRPEVLGEHRDRGRYPVR